MLLRKAPRAAPVLPPATFATARRGRPEAYPKGRPNPQDPKGGAGATPRHTALRRGEGGRRPTQRAATTPQDPRKAAPAPPLATLRYILYGAASRRGRPVAYPKGRPYRQKSDPAPPEIGSEGFEAGSPTLPPNMV